MSRSLPRRRVLQAITALLLVAPGATLLQACGAPSSPAPTAAPPAPTQKPAAPPPTAPAAATAPPAAPAATTAAPTAAPAATTVAAAPAAKGPQLSFQGEIVHNPRFIYMPTAPEKSAANPTPHVALRKLADEWEKNHPGIKIRFVDDGNFDDGPYYIWLRTQITGATGPDVFFAHLSTGQQFVDDGLIVAVEQYLNQPNPYVPGNTKWLDQLPDAYPRLATSPLGHIGTIAYDMPATAVYFNKEIFDKVGIKGPPATFKDFLGILKQLKDAGHQPYGTIYGYSWMWSIVGDLLMWNLIPKLDSLNYRFGMFEQVVDAEEAVRAISKGLLVPSKEPALRDTWKIVKEWSQYFMDGWSADDKGRADLRYVEGRVATFWGGTWDFARIVNDPNKKHGDGFFYIPPITKDTSSFVKEPPLQPVGLGGLGPGWIINQAAKKRGNVEAIIDWIQWCMAPANNELFVNEQPQFVPAVKGTKARQELQPFLDSLKRQGPNGGFQITPGAFFGELWTDADRNNILYLLGQLPEDELFKRLDEIALKNADVQIKKFDKAKNPEKGAWDLTKW